MDLLNKNCQERRKEEYQMQLFEFCSSQFANEGKEEVMAVIEEAATAFERSLFEKYQSVDRDTIQLATRKLIEAYSVAVEEWSPSFQEKLDSNFFCIPSNVLLEEDKPQEIQYSSEDVERVEKEIRDLERKLIGAKYMKEKLLETLKAAKETQRDRKRYLDSTRSTVPTSCDLVKAITKVDHKRRKCNDMDGSLMEPSNHGNSEKGLAIKKEIPGKKQYKVSYTNPKYRKISPEL